MTARGVNTVAATMPTHVKVRDAIRALLVNMPTGATPGSLIPLIPCGPNHVRAELSKMAALGMLFVIQKGTGRCCGSRYFLTEAVRDAARPAVLAEWAAEVAARAERKVKLRRIAQRRLHAAQAAAAGKVVKPRKPRAAPKPERAAIKPPIQNTTIRARPATPALDKFKSQAAYIPDHVKVQRVPTPKPLFYVDPGFVGDFSRLGIGQYLDART